VKDKDKTKKKFEKEPENLQKRITKLKAQETERKKIEEALRDSEEKYRTLTENVNVGVYRNTVGPKGKFTEANPAIVKMFGYKSRDEFLSVNVSDLYKNPDDRRIFNEKILRLGFVKDEELQLKKKDGTPFFASVLAVAVKDEKGKVKYYDGIIEDITERKKAEEALQESEERYRNLFENASDILFTIDRWGRFTSGNKKGEEISGYKREELIGKPFKKIVPLKYLPNLMKLVEKGFKGETEHAQIEIEIKNRKGQLIPLEITGRPIWKDGKVIAIQGVARDITERKKAERALRDSEKLFRSVVEHSHGGIFIVDSDYRFIYVNNELCRILDYPCKEIIGHDFRGFIDEESEKLVSDRYVRRQKGEKVPARYEFNVIRKDGKEKRVEINSTVIKDSEGNTQTMAQILDITERKQAEEALRRSEEKYRTMIEHSNDLIWTLDKQGNFTFFNKEELSGYKLADWMGKSFAPLILPEDLPKVTQVFLETLSGKPQQYEVRVYKKDGSIFVLSVNTAPIFKNDEVVGTVSFGHDITEQKKAEEALASEKERLTVTLHSIGDGVISTNIEGRIVLMNKVAENLTGWTQEETIGKPICEVFHIINKETRKPCEDPVKRVIEQGGTYRLTNDTILISRDGRERIIADSGAPIRDKESKVIGVVLVFRDITEKQKMEEELQKIEKLESLGVLAGGIAHDFNNILTGILGNVTLAKLDTDPGDEIFQILAEAEKATTQAKNLTQQLLTFSRGGAPLKKTVYIGKIIKDSANFALSGSNVTCAFSIPEDLLLVKVDERQISQVINNLIINADQAMPEGGVIKVELNNITVGGKEALPIREGKYVKIIIEDHGVGIPGEHLQKIFDPYFTTKQKGSGLGLATAFSIVKQHDGYITVESKQGTGTTFSIYLPASVEGIKKEKETKEAFIPGRGRVLLVDDEKVVRDATGRMLKKLGYDVEFAREGNSALELYKEAKKVGNPFNAVIMDLTIPGGMGGEETIQKLLKIDPKVRAIVSSGYSTDPIMANYKDYGFKGIIVKPYKTEELGEILHRVIED